MFVLNNQCNYKINVQCDDTTNPSVNNKQSYRFFVNLNDAVYWSPDHFKLFENS